MAEVIVETSAGKVAGSSDDDGLAVFKGIPYGAGASGRARFLPAQPAPAWSGVKSAEQFGPMAVQPRVPDENAGSDPLGEDCLVLNVWTGDLSGSAPVMVWLHGGAFTTGSGSAASNDGSNLVRDGEVVVVALNHRLGALGYLYLAEALGEDYEASGNVGMLDIVLALRWVRENIAAFGGNPNNVTIFGVSGGGSKVLHLLAMPEAKGLFHKAIAQSGANFQGLRGGVPLAFAQQVTERYLAALGIDADHAAHLLDVDSERLLEAQLEVGRGLGAHGAYFPAAFVPVIDGNHLPLAVDAQLRLGVAADVPLIVGTNLHEATYLWTARLRREVEGFAMSEDEMIEWLSALCGDSSAEMVRVYEKARGDESDLERFVAIASDLFRVASVRVVEDQLVRANAPVYMYLFSFESPLVHPGAVHGLDVAFVFDNLSAHRYSATVGEDGQALAQTMSQAWASFAYRGVPLAAGLERWRPYDLEQRQTMIFGAHSQLVADPGREERLSWPAEIYADPELGAGLS